jgi:protein-S-isoprenylcysteine O-methyltransferase Ste14
VEQHRIEDFGPYGSIRHPAYSGTTVVHAGLTPYFLHGVALAVLPVLLVPSIMLRIMIEEKMLCEIDGDSEFVRKGERLFPVIG